VHPPGGLQGLGEPGLGQVESGQVQIGVGEGLVVERDRGGLAEEALGLVILAQGQRGLSCIAKIGAVQRPVVLAGFLQQALEGIVGCLGVSILHLQGAQAVPGHDPGHRVSASEGLGEFLARLDLSVQLHQGPGELGGHHRSSSQASELLQDRHLFLVEIHLGQDQAQLEEGQGIELEGLRDAPVRGLQRQFPALLEVVAGSGEVSLRAVQHEAHQHLACVGIRISSQDSVGKFPPGDKVLWPVDQARHLLRCGRVRGGRRIAGQDRPGQKAQHEGEHQKDQGCPPGLQHPGGPPGASDLARGRCGLVQSAHRRVERVRVSMAGRVHSRITSEASSIPGASSIRWAKTKGAR